MTIDLPENIVDEKSRPKAVGRRTVLAGAAWTVPAVALAAAAPAHAASGLVLRFDKSSYPADGCSTLSGVKVSLHDGENPVGGATVTVYLPQGLTFVAGGPAASGPTDDDGVFTVPDIHVSAAGATHAMSAISVNNVVTAAAVAVTPHTSALGTPAAVLPAQQWKNVPSGSTPVGANFYLSPAGELWYEDRQVVSNVVAAAGYWTKGNFTGWAWQWEQADFLLADGQNYYVYQANTPQEYSSVPDGYRPVGRAYFLSDDGDLVWGWGGLPVVSNVKSVVTWGTDDLYADIELKTGVLVRARYEKIVETFSPLPESARPVGADYTLSADGDLFYQGRFVAARVTSAVGWYNGYWGGQFADYTTERGEALRARDTDPVDPRDHVYQNIPAGAKAVGPFYFLSENGDLYYDSQLALSNIDVATGWSTWGGTAHADVRMKSGAAIRLTGTTVDELDSPLPANALAIGACFFFDSGSGELYYQGRLVATGVVRAAGWHHVDEGDFADYVTVRGEVLRASWNSPNHTVYTGVPSTATPLGGQYFLDDGVLRWRSTVVVHGVASAIAREDGRNTCADFQLLSGTSGRARDGAIDATYSPMPDDVDAAGADYFLSPSGELFWQGQLVATDVISAAGYRFYNWNNQACEYVTSDGVGYQASDAKPRDRVFPAPAGDAYIRALVGGYYLTESMNLHFRGVAVNYPNSSERMVVEAIVAWQDRGNSHADVRAADGKVRRIWDNNVERNFDAPLDGSKPLGASYFLTPSQDLYFGDKPEGSRVAQNVVDAVGWFDSPANRAKVDYRDAGGVWVAAEAGNATTYSGAPSAGSLLGFGYFLTPAEELFFGNVHVADVASVTAWSDRDRFFATYRDRDGDAVRAQGAGTGATDKTPLFAGKTARDAELVGARYALAPDGDLWFDGVLVASSVSAAVGWYFRDRDAFYADYIVGTTARRVLKQRKEDVPEVFTYGDVLATTQLLGYGYYLTGNGLWFEDGRSAIAEGVTSGGAWANRGEKFCDYRTETFAAYRASNGDPDQQTWTKGKTPLGSEPKGSDYYLSSEGVLTFRGDIVANSVSSAVGWFNTGGDTPYADFVDSTGKALRARSTSVDDVIYAGVPASSNPAGAGYWLTGDSLLFFESAQIATDVAWAGGWTRDYTPPQYATYRLRTGGLARARGSAATEQVWVQGATPSFAKPIGEQYFLNGTDLWFRSEIVATGVATAIGWQSPDGNVQFADIALLTGVAYRLRGAAPEGSPFVGIPADAVPVGSGYYVAKGVLFFEGSEIDQHVSAAVGWFNSAKRVSYAKVVDCP